MNDFLLPAQSAAARTGWLRTVTANPLTGLAPWIALALLEGPLPVLWAGVVAFALALAAFTFDRMSGSTTKILSVVDVICFAALVVVAAAAPGTRNWLELWFGEIANILLTAVAFGSMALRVPFTIQYAKERTSPDTWASELFYKINYRITAVWALAFLIAGLSGFYADAVLKEQNNVWTAWVIPVAAFIAAVRFAARYPEQATKLRREATA